MDDNIDDYINEELIYNIYNNSFSKFECLKEFINLIIDDLLNSIYEKNINKLNQIYIFIKDKIINLDKDDIFNEHINNKDLNFKYIELKNIFENIFNLNDIFDLNSNLPLLSHLLELLNN